MLKQATTVNDVRPGEALEQQYGYLPEDGTYGCCNSHGVVATLLEYDNADLALSHFATALGDSKDAAMLEQRANNWENMFDPNNDLLTARYENGQFVAGITPTTQRTTSPTTSRATPTSTCGTRRTTTQALFSCSAATPRSCPRCRQYLSQPNGFGMFDELDQRVRLRRAVRARLRRRPGRDPAGGHNIENTDVPARAERPGQQR